jgi:hypothetical protein
MVLLNITSDFTVVLTDSFVAHFVKWTHFDTYSSYYGTPDIIVAIKSGKMG